MVQGLGHPACRGDESLGTDFQAAIPQPGDTAHISLVRSMRFRRSLAKL